MALPFVDTRKMVCLEKAKIKATGMWEPVAGEPYSGKKGYLYFTTSEDKKHEDPKL